jgi:DNA-binding CsgD family transcriptional regulator
MVDKAANSLWQSALAGLSSTVADVRSFAVRSPQMRDVTVVHLLPTTGLARDIFNGAYGLMVFTPVHTDEGVDAKVIRALFDLTPSEARVARGIAQGRTVAEIARTSGLTLGTVRSQLKAVFAKTGSHRQTDVAVLLAGLSRLPIPKI